MKMKRRLVFFFFDVSSFEFFALFLLQPVVFISAVNTIFFSWWSKILSPILSEPVYVAIESLHPFLLYLRLLASFNSTHFSFLINSKIFFCINPRFINNNNNNDNINTNKNQLKLKSKSFPHLIYILYFILLLLIKMA